MNKRLLAILAFLVPLLFSHGLQAATGEQVSAVAAMGEMNGIALQCRYVQQTRRIKSELVAHLPKERQLGLLFEEATNKSFLASLENGDGCPGEEVLGERVDAGVEKLKMAFPE